MKSTRKWLSLTLAAVLAVCLSIPALAADTTSEPAAPEEIAAAFAALLDGQGFEYEDRGVTSTGDYWLEVVFPGENKAEHFVTLFIDGGGESYFAYERNILRYDAGDRARILEMINSLNRSAPCVIFTAESGSVSAERHGDLLGTPEQAGELMLKSVFYLPEAVDGALPTLSGETRETRLADSPFLGEWRFSLIRMEAEGVPDGLTVTARDLGSDGLFVFRLSEDGTATVITPAEDGETAAAWDVRGSGAVLFLHGKEHPLRLSGENLQLDAWETEGYRLTMVRAGG